jgi:deferrochelatase/peroxidase EfeB
MSPLDRRQFVSRSLGALGGLSLGAVGGVVVERDRETSAAGTPGELRTRVLRSELAAAQPFDGPHQAGILTVAPAQATFAALDAVAPSRLALSDALQALTVRARELTHGGVYPKLETDAPPFDSGVLGPSNAPDELTVTAAFGASLFDARYGLAARKPAGLTRMPSFPVDDLDATRCHGDVLLQICAGQRDTVVHTLRELLRTVRGSLQLRWSIDGFKGAQRGPSPRSTPRNLFAFRDGTANPDVGDDALMDRLVWLGANTGPQAWTAGGTFQVVRVIRMHVEFWDRVGLTEQQTMIGRVRDTGAPLGGTDEFEDPRLDLDPPGRRISLESHIRLANPRTQATADQRILRRPFNYHRGFDRSGDLDQGLIFVAFNRDIERQFATIQKRLNAEPMIDYVTPVGGGYFFAPAGARGPGDWLGSGMFV